MHSRLKGPFSNGSFSTRFLQNPAVLVGDISKVTDGLTIYDSRLALEMNLRRFLKASMDPKIQIEGRTRCGPKPT